MHCCIHDVQFCPVTEIIEQLAIHNMKHFLKSIKISKQSSSLRLCTVPLALGTNMSLGFQAALQGQSLPQKNLQSIWTRNKKDGVKRAKGSLLLYLFAKRTEEREELRFVPDLLQVCPCFSAARGLLAMSLACATHRLFLCHQDSHSKVLQECYCMLNPHPVLIHRTLQA